VKVQRFNANKSAIQYNSLKIWSRLRSRRIDLCKTLGGPSRGSARILL